VGTLRVIFRLKIAVSNTPIQSAEHHTLPKLRPGHGRTAVLPQPDAITRHVGI
jgi:hypothetical protein